MNSMRTARWAFAIALVVGASILPARAQQKVPGAELQEVLIKACAAELQRCECDRQLRGLSRQAVEAVPRSVLAREAGRNLQGIPRQANRFRHHRRQEADRHRRAEDRGQRHPVDQGLLRDHAEPRELRPRLHHVRRRVEADQGQCRREEAVAVHGARDERADRLVARGGRHDLGIEQALPEQIAVEQDGAFLRLHARPAERAEQLADMAQPLAVDAAHAFRGSLIGSRKRADRQLDREAADIGVPGVEVGEVSQDRARRSARGRLLADRRNAALGPGGEHRIEEGAPVGEMPVEAALGDADRLGERLHAHRVNAAVGQRIEGSRDPGLRVETGHLFLFCSRRLRHACHLTPYGSVCQTYGNVWRADCLEAKSAREVAHDPECLAGLRLRAR